MLEPQTRSKFSSIQNVVTKTAFKKRLKYVTCLWVEHLWVTLAIESWSQPADRYKLVPLEQPSIPYPFRLETTSKCFLLNHQNIQWTKTNGPVDK